MGAALQRIPRLPFGDAQAQSCDSEKISADRVARVLRPLKGYESRSRDFLQKSAYVRINGLELFAASTTPTYMQFGQTDYVQQGLLYVAIPLRGAAVGALEGRDFQFIPGRRGLLVSEAEDVVWKGGTRSTLGIKLNRNRLLLTAAAMIGANRAEVSLDIERSRELDLRAGGLDLSQGIKDLCNYIDGFWDNVAALEMLAVDELLYRQLVFLLIPELLAGESARAAFRDPGNSMRMDAVCDAVKSRLDRPLSLTEMETISGLSRRSLQYAFKKRFGYSPIDWQKRERLLAARETLLRAGGSLSISEIAHAFGFSSPSSFGADYRRMFGETPSETLLCRRVDRMKMS